MAFQGRQIIQYDLIQHHGVLSLMLPVSFKLSVDHRFTGSALHSSMFVFRLVDACPRIPNSSRVLRNLIPAERRVSREYVCGFTELNFNDKK